MRYNDWQSRLSLYLSSVKDKPFEWGAHDCALFSCNCILQETGDDPAAWFRGKYSTKAAAYQALKEFAGGGLEETAVKITTARNYPEVLPLMAQRGDVALCNMGGNDTLGIISFTGRHVLIAADVGIAAHPLSIIRRAWRVE